MITTESCTGDDCRDSETVNIPDLLRLVPGLDVARIDANTRAISIRILNTGPLDRRPFRWYTFILGPLLGSTKCATRI